jgi:hypothetical protein
MRLVVLIELKVIGIGWMQRSSSTVIHTYLYGHPRFMVRSYRQELKLEEPLTQIDAILCNHAEAVNNLLYIAGGGIEISFVQAGAAPPYAVTIGIGIMVTVPWGQTNQQHTVEIELISEDGQPVQVPVMQDVMQPLHSLLAFNVGRPPGLTVGDDQHVCLAANLAALPMPSLGKYEFIIRVDGHDERRLPYRVMPAPGTQMIAGPSSLPGPSQLPA